VAKADREGMTMTGAIRPALAAAALVVTALASGAASGNEAERIMQRVHDQARLHENQTSQARLVIVDAKGGTRERHFRSLHRIFADRTKTLIKFEKPANIRGTGLLSETLDGEEETRQWIYLPALRSVKQLDFEDRHKSFMGSDFTNADVSGRNVGQDTHRIVARKGDIVTIRSVPKDPRDPYSYLDTDVIDAISVPSEVRFHDRRGRAVKTLRNEEVGTVEGMYVVVRSTMTSHATRGQSTLIRERIDVRSAIGTHEVGFRGLRR